MYIFYFIDIFYFVFVFYIVKVKGYEDFIGGVFGLGISGEIILVIVVEGKFFVFI